MRVQQPSIADNVSTECRSSDLEAGVRGRNFLTGGATDLGLWRYIHSGGTYRHFALHGETPMTSRFRSCVFAAAAAALVSSQAVYAAPAASAIDPLVSLSVLASEPSRAAVCAGSTATVSAAAAAAAAAQGPAGCVLPVTAPPPPPVAQAAPPPPIAGAAAPKSFGVLPILLGLAALAAVIALIASSGNDRGGDVTPVSPA